MVSASRLDSSVPLSSSLPTALIHTPIVAPVIPYHDSTTLAQTPIANQLQTTYNNAVAAINPAYQAATAQVNNSYQNVTYVYNTTSNAIASDTTGLRDDINQRIDAIQNHISADLSNTLTNITNAVGAIHSDQINQANTLIHDITANLTAITDHLNNRVGVDISPIAQVVDSISNQLIEDVHSSQDNTRQAITAIYDTQNRYLADAKTNTENLIHGISETLNHVVSDAIDNIVKQNPHTTNLFGLTDDQLTTLINNIWNILFQGIRKFAIVSGLEINDNARQQAQDYASNFKDIPHRFQDIFSKLKNDDYSTLDDFITDFSGTQVGHLLFDLVLNIMTVLSGASKLTDIATAPYYQKLMQLGLADVTPNIPDINELTRLYFRGELDHPEFTTYSNKLGYNTTLSDGILNASKTKLTAYEYLKNTFTFQKNIDDMKRSLYMLGYDAKDIDLMIENYQGGIPPIQDLIRFMVRDTFSPIAEKYGQFEDFPEKIMDFWEAQPIGDSWARHYWASHWELPAIQQVIEMFQRRDGNSDNPIVSYDELQQFLKAKDIMPFWRDKLTKVAYHPITRIDVRRIYNMGGKDKHWVYNQYLNAGYSPESAEDLATFVVNSENETDEQINKHIRKIAEQIIKLSFDREIINASEAQTRLANSGMNAREAAITANLWQFDKDTERDYRIRQTQSNQIISQVKADYEKRIIDRDYATNLMLGAGLTQQEVNHELQFADTKAFLKLRELQIDAIHAELVKWRLDRNQAIQRLQAIGAKQQEIDYLLLLWIAEREKKDKQLSESDVNKIYEKGLMTVDQYRQYLTSLGFDSQEIVWLEGLHKPNATTQQ